MTRRTAAGIGIGIGLLAISVDVRSQTTHPCDQILSGTQVVILPDAGGKFGVGYCHDGKDKNGNQTALVGVVVSVDGAAVYSGPATVAQAAGTAGLTYYTTPKTLSATLGPTHVVTVVVKNAQGDASLSAAVSFQLGLAAAVATPASGVRIVP